MTLKKNMDCKERLEKIIQSKLDTYLMTLEFDKVILDILIDNKVSFYFKGGTSLHLLYKFMNRISQDVDIAVDKEEPQILEKIKLILENNGIKVSQETDEFAYGIIYRIEYKSLFTYLDISQYLNYKKISSFNNSNFSNTYSKKLRWNIFPVFLTITEKLLALQSRFALLESEEKFNESQKRIFRHFVDLYILLRNISSNLEKLEKHWIQQAFSFVFENEINPERFNNFKNVSDFNIFNTGSLLNLGDKYNSWSGDEFVGDKPNLEWKEIIKAIKEYKKIFNDILLNNNIWGVT